VTLHRPKTKTRGAGAEQVGGPKSPEARGLKYAWGPLEILVTCWVGRIGMAV
jgi:hypothetical protein